MKRIFLLATVALLTFALLAGCSTSQPEQPPVTDPTAAPTAEPAVEPTVEPETDAVTYYTEEVYAQQIELYYIAVAQQWDSVTYMDNAMCSMAAFYYGDNALENIGFTFIDLDNDGISELIIGTILNAELDPLVFEIWTVKNGAPELLAQSGSHNRYYLRHSEQDGLWTVALEAENGAASRAVYYLQLVAGQFQVTDGVICDYLVSETDPWFATTDMDWNVSNDTPITTDTANATMAAGKATYVAADYTPYSLYN